ncbi:amino acid permease [Colletotrichum kahawae]|uniref:Amino acid permease n=1 Tax=Colletotrichum kahawae TaxID=34407 RepID=A0AAE0D0F5_COLKA|nr:amino acid permease [Colletotrichum kahawae]
MTAASEDKGAISALNRTNTRSDDSAPNEKRGSISNSFRQSGEVHVSSQNVDQLQRHLTNRHIQLIAIGGSIGTALFVSIGTGLQRGGPASLLIGYTLHSVMVGLVNNCMAEMCVYMPITGSFIRYAGKWVDEALGFMKQGFKTVYWRFGVFFIGSAIAIGIVVPYNDPKLENAGAGTADGSPYVIALKNMSIEVLPHIINALLCTSIFSAGNAYTYCAMRSLYGLALDGQAPPIFKKCLKNGIPIWAFALVMLFPLLSFLQVSNNTAKVVTMLQSLTQAAQLLNYVVICVVYVFFYRACNAQGLIRRNLPYYGYFQPYCAYIGIVWMTFMVTCFGYATFLPGHWDTLTFFSYYTMIFVGIITFTVWKLLKKTRFVPAAEADLVWDKPIIDAYEAQFTDPPSSFRGSIRKLFGKKNKHESEMVA